MKQKIKVRLLTNNGVLPGLTHKGDWIDLCAAATVEFKVPQIFYNKEKDKPPSAKNNLQWFNYFDYVEQGKPKGLVFDYQLIPLGIAIQLPPGYEAVIAPRSSTFKYYGLICANSIGVIDNTYSGNNDQWMFAAIAFKDTIVAEGQRVCQFRIQLSQKASIFQKIKWLFTNKFEFIQTDNLDNSDRGGFGSTGI